MGKSGPSPTLLLLKESDTTEEPAMGRLLWKVT